MMEPQPQDTPFKRASILDMDDKQLVALTEELQKRRLQTWNIYQAGLASKAEAKQEKDIAQLGKACERFLKKYETVSKSLDALEKLAIDIQALRLTVGG